MDTVTIQTWLSIIKDIVTIVAAGVAAYVGFRGLQTWQRQLRANAEYDLARRVLVAVYKLREAVDKCRVYLRSEDSGTKELHRARIAQLDEEYARFGVELLEAQTVWGEEDGFGGSIRAFMPAVMEMKFAFREYYFDNVPEAVKLYTTKEEARLVLFARLGNDKFNTKLEDAVKGIEDVLRPKLTLKQAKKKVHWWDRFKKRKK